MNKNGTPQNLQPQAAKWKRPTVAIRIPEAFRDAVLRYARALDNGEAVNKTVKLSELKTYKLRGSEVVKVEDLVKLGLLELD